MSQPDIGQQRMGTYASKEANNSTMETLITSAILVTSYRCTKCGITVMVAVNAHRVACWRCQKRMKAVKVESVLQEEG